MRALHFAQARRTIVLWLFAEDRPLSQNIELLRDETISERRQQWTSYHEMKTSGIMGLQPLVYDMPLRITQTDHKRKHLGLFKNARWRLHGWELHIADEARYKECQTLEFVLQYMPVSAKGIYDASDSTPKILG